jgi:hypothetical protein
MKGMSFEDWWEADHDTEIKLDKDSAARVWEAAQQHHKDESERSVLLYKTLFPLANGLRAFLDEHVPESVFVMANGKWILRAFREELDYIKRELGD